LRASHNKRILKQVYDRSYKYEQEYGCCPQCVLGAIQDVFPIVTDEVFKASYGLAGGMGLTTNGTCGALVGGVIALSCKSGRCRKDFAKGRYLKSYALARRLHDRFVGEYGTVICTEVHRKIFGRAYDMWDRNEYKEFERAGGHRDKCPGVVANVAMWVAEMLLDEGQSSII
jgi:C_GCAxxG_C_C family probable redox protein